MKTMPIRTPRTLRWTVERYDRLVDSGLLDRKRVELIDGRIVQMPPQKEPHAVSIILAAQVLRRVFGDGYTVRQQMSLHVDERSKLEPDIAVVTGDARTSLAAGTPKSAVLVIEISDTLLKYDRGRKASRYAKAKIADYWIVNLVQRQIEIHRQPAVDRSSQWNYGYGSITVLKAGDSVSPLAAPNMPIVVGDLLP